MTSLYQNIRPGDSKLILRITLPSVQPLKLEVLRLSVLLKNKTRNLAGLIAFYESLTDDLR